MSVENKTNSKSNHWIQPGQGGHEGWRLPMCMAHLPRMPLYLTVAWWGMSLGCAFTRQDVSKVFCISPRRASAILAYIAHRCSTRIKSEFTVKPSGTGPQVMNLKIVSIDYEIKPPTHIKPKPDITCKLQLPIKDEQAKQRELAQWVLSRPRGNATALTVWQARCPVGLK
ncbi:CaiF/GrlA family transcriptional regulator [Citrobacter amalonaticus]|nr:CaiF/GrlA family transcriptional regulator [Citrobacter amalonaticus]